MNRRQGVQNHLAQQSLGLGHRGLILGYPYPTNRHGSPLPLPPRPNLSAKTVEADVRKAIPSSWKSYFAGEDVRISHTRNFKLRH